MTALTPSEIDTPIEPILEPDLPIIDAHHHLWYLAGSFLDQLRTRNDPMYPVLSARSKYLFDEVMADLSTGHNIRATVYVEANAMYRAEGREEMKSVGEVEFVNGIAAMAASGAFGEVKLCAGIVGNANLRLGEHVEPILNAQIQAGGERYRGVRNITASNSEGKGALRAFSAIAPGILADSRFRAGFGKLQGLGLSYDAVVFQPQLPEVIDLARAFPQTVIILNHVGIPIYVREHATERKERYRKWLGDIRSLAGCRNVFVKLGGLGQAFGGFKAFRSEPPATSEQIAQEWKPFLEPCIEIFGADRCMFESNFPVDSGSCSYPVLWNVFKRIAAGVSVSEKAALFSSTAQRVYRLNV